MRVIAGEAKGRTLIVPRGGGTRAATDRIRETLFAILEPELPGARVLDLFAGAGTLGIEALSRGAIHATFVERGKVAAGALRKNLAATHFTDRASVVEANVLSFLNEPPVEPFDLAFCDPPFADVGLANATLAHPGLAAALPAGALVVTRFHTKHPHSPPRLARVMRTKEIGEETILFLRYSGSAAGG
jgi:16S rRNA (guanine966-N2)-methyltransferase